jgi:hypothetical protein
VSPGFSRRTGWDRSPTLLARALAARRDAGLPVLDLTASNPTRAGLDFPPGLLADLGDAGGLVYEPEPLGRLEAREAVAADYARRGVETQPGRIVLTASTSEAYAWLLKLLCDAGDRILVPRPSYPLFDYLADLEAVEVGSYPLLFDGLWHVDPEAVAAALTPRTRAVFVVSPNNPTGSWLSRAAARALRKLCAERGLALVSDEVFADFPLRPRDDRQPSLADDGPGLSFGLGGLSKSCGLPQLKLAWIAVAGPEAPRREALARLELIADSYLSVSTPVQRAAPGLLARKDAIAGPIRVRLAESLDTLEAALARPGCPVSLLEVEGGWSAVLRVPVTHPDEEVVRGLLERRGVLLHPGSLYGFAPQGYLVASLLSTADELRLGIGRLLEDLGGVL